MDEYLRLESHRECSVPCRRAEELPGCILEAESSSAEVVELCPRNCIGTRSIQGMQSSRMTTDR